MRALITFAILAWSTLVLADEPEILRGQWGGPGASLWAGASGADGDFFCSMGRITQPIELDDEGHFCVVGYMDYFDGTPPIKQISATYIGDVKDDVMRVTVNMPDREPWHFELRKGEMGDSAKCAVAQ